MHCGPSVESTFASGALQLQIRDLTIPPDNRNPGLKWSVFVVIKRNLASQYCFVL
ncbi:hypothetical protein AVEN_78-1, partial [Araneus ventricosus]